MRSRTLYLASLVTAVLLVLLVAATLATRGTRASPGILYVATDGDDTKNCDTIDDRCRTVQRAINVATTLDEIRVATGTYTDTAGTVAEITETITLKGGWDTGFTIQDPSTYPTTLDAQGLGRVVEISGSISPTIEGFIITGGNANAEANYPHKGGGIFSIGADPIIVNNVITNNIATTGDQGCGGGLSLFNASASAVITGNQILSNTATTGDQGLGGGVCLTNSDATVRGNTIRDNTGPKGGGGLTLSSSEATLEGNRIISNTASNWGGGLYVMRSTPFTLTNNIIAWNQSDGQGGGVYVWGTDGDPASGTLINNTIAQNNLGSGGEGVYAMATGTTTGTNTLTLTNNIIVSHTWGIYAASSNASATADYTLFYDNSDGHTGGPGTITSTNAITGSDPLFLNPIAWDYHIRRLSSAIDAGNPASIEPTTDFEGDPRPIDGDKDGDARFDIGADEFSLINDLFLPLIKKNY